MNEMCLGILSVSVITLVSMVVPAVYGISLDADLFYVGVAAITGMAGYDLKRKADLKSIQ